VTPTDEALLVGVARREVMAQELDRDGALEQHVLAAKHVGHAALAEQLAHLVPGEPLWGAERRHRGDHNRRAVG
jgi:hypothetical protein